MLTSKNNKIKVALINNGFDKPFTPKEFEAKYGFQPTTASVIFFKALYGDKSDNINGALMKKKMKSITDIKKLGFEFIKEISHSKDDFETILTRLKSYNFMDLEKKKNKFSCEESLFFEMNCLDTKYEVTGQFFENVRVIRSICKNYKPYATNKNDDIEYNSFIEKVLNRAKKEKKKFKFGKIHETC